jgi:hypothetical protein
MRRLLPTAADKEKTIICFEQVLGHAQMLCVRARAEAPYELVNLHISAIASTS